MHLKGDVLEESKQTILFLSEASLFLEFSKECFKQAGHDFFDFENWDDCKLQISDLSPTLIIADFDFYELTDLSEAKSLGVPVIGFYSEEDEGKVSVLELNGLIKKPIEALELVSRCLEFLGK